MCGIAGLLTHRSTPYPMEEPIRAMQVALRHRGPDDAGIYLSSNHQAALAHTRLSILDLSPTGHQPMATPDERYWITFNGEIYNFQALRTQLEHQGETFQSQTDTEIILKLYRRHGKACLNQLRGMFAFAIWDDHEKSCFLARDPLGIKPLYYCQSGSTFGFASELRALQASGLPKRQLSSQGLYGYLRTGSVPEPYTLIEGVHSLEAGHWLYWQHGNLQQEPYWTIQFGSDQSLVPDAQDRVRQALLDSVQSHYVSDVPVGVFLSGGIDSTAVVALSRQVHQGDLKTYSIAFEDPTWNEGTLARQVAETFATDHTEYLMTAAESRHLFPKFLEAVDQPSVDGFNSFCVSHVAHIHSQKVVLSGLGGDELFAGYKSFQTLPKMMQWGQRIAPLKPLGQLAHVPLSRWGTPKTRRLADFAQQPTSLSNAYYSLRGIFSHQEALALVQQILPDAPTPLPLPEMSPGSQPTMADSISALEMSHYMRNQLLRDSDVMSMTWGLELRVPFVDRQLIESIAAIPSQCRLAYGKQLLTQAVPEIPAWVINRPKQGFHFPFEQWFAHDWSDLISDLPYPDWIPLRPWYRRWSLMVLQNWRQKVNL